MQLEDATDAVRTSPEVEVHFDEAINTMRDEVQAVIGDVLGQMHVPTAADHLFGAIGTFINHKIMKDMGGMEWIAALAGAPEPSPLTESDISA
ncbi:MAG: hypothetical protein ACPGGE_02020 [Poseidonia sp.]